MKLKKLLIAMAIPLAAGIGCSDSGGGAAPVAVVAGTPGDLEGQISNLGGLTFTTSGGAEGTTDDAGGFTYFAGDTVSFFLGGVKIGEAKAEVLMTLLHLHNDVNVSSSTTRVTDIMRFLIAVDDDGFFGNGLQVSDEARAIAKAVNYDFSDTDIPFNESAANSLVAAINKTKSFENLSTSPVSDIPGFTATVELDSIITNTGPLVVHTTPTYRDGEDVDVLPLLDSIDVQFSSPVQADTVDGSSFTVTDAAGNVVTGSVVSTGGLSASFDPDAILANDTVYTVTLSTLILDASDKPLPADFAFSFTTAAAQTTPVACIDNTSLNLATNTSGNSVVNISFSMIDCSGNAITGLTASDFSFFEGAGLDPVFNDAYETYRGYPATGFINTRTDTVILIDNSTSVSDADFDTYVAQAKVQLVSGGNNNSVLLEGQRVRIYTFDAGLTEITTGYTQDTVVLADLLKTLTTTRPANSPTTNLYGAISVAATAMGAPGQTTNNTMIVLSDAIDTSAVSTLTAAVTTLQTNDVDVYLRSQNASVDAIIQASLNLQTSAAAIQSDIAALKAEKVNFINSLYDFQYASPKRGGTHDFNFVAAGNTNLTATDTLLAGGVNATGFTDETPVLRLMDNEKALVVTTTLSVQAVSEFAASSNNYAWSSDDANVATVTKGSDQSTATIDGVAAGTAILTINDNANNLNQTVKIYVGDKYEWNFESNTISGWSAGAGWGNVAVSTSDRRNSSDFAIGLPDAADVDGLYASDLANVNFTSPAMDLTRFAGGSPVLEFKYKLRNASAADTVRVEIVDNGATGTTVLTTLSGFTHDWRDSATLDLSPYTGASYDTATIRFVFNSDATGEYEGFQLDDVAVYPTR